MRDAVIFGTGEIGQNALPFLERNWHILFAVDNDEMKWGKEFGRYSVKLPDSIERHCCDVIITSTKYADEIAKQLQQMGIHQDRIYFCHRFFIGASYEYEVYPMNEEMLVGAEQPLIQYDLLHEEEQETKYRKVLIFCSFYSTYTKQLIENMSKRYKDVELSLLTSARECREKIMAEQLRHIYCYQSKADLKAILQQIPMYDAMQLLWIEMEWVYFCRLIRSKTKRLNLNVGGSDFYRVGKAKRDYRKKLIECADRITAETEGTVLEFQTYYLKEAGNKSSLLPFGIEVLDYIDNNFNTSKDMLREKYHIPTDKIVVTCGHNANEAHQHIKMIEALEQLPEHIRQQIVFVFPMTYLQGRIGYVDSVMDRLRETKMDYVVLTEYMDFQSMAEYALISDIMIHVQTTDQLSSTMLEEMYAGSIVIAGSWLPYRSLHEMGIYFLDVNTIPDVTAVLEDVVMNIESYKEKCVGNSEIVWRHSSWDVLAPKWRALWD